MIKSLEPVVITGLGVVTAVGQGVAEFAAGLRNGVCGIRRFAGPPPSLGAFLPDFSTTRFLESLTGCSDEIRKKSARVLRQAPHSLHITVAAAIEAWHSAGWHQSPPNPDRIGIVGGGNNLNQRYLANSWRKMNEDPALVSPRHVYLALDTNVVGAVSDILGIHGFGLMAGGSSASGNVAVWNAKHLVQSGAADCVLVAGASAELSALEFRAFSAAGASAPVESDRKPEEAYRPFDRSTQGFIPGEGSACLVLESASSAKRRGARILAALASASLVLDASHTTQANPDGEIRAMRLALSEAGLTPDQIDYVNAHGSGSRQGDPCECKALSEVFSTSRPWVNSTKSLTGHCLTSAGLIELVASALQMRDCFLHPNRNLHSPIDSSIRFAGPTAIETAIRTVLSNSFGFGGINSSIILTSAPALV